MSKPGERMPSEDNTPEARAYRDALADAVEQGIYGEEALLYADRARGTVWFQARALHYAGVDVGAAIMRTPPGRRLTRFLEALARQN